MKTFFAYLEGKTLHSLPRERRDRPSTLACQPRTKNQEPGTRNPARRAGFTIIELLAVIMLIAMLIALLFGAAQYVIKTARQQQANTTASALQVAIASYRHEYGQWPVDPSLVSSITNGMLKVAGSKNYLVFDMLRSSSGSTLNQYNTNNVSFVDNSTVLATPDNGASCTRRYLLPSSGGLIQSGCPIVYVPRDGGIGYFSVTIWFELDKVEVDL